MAEGIISQHTEITENNTTENKNYQIDISGNISFNGIGAYYRYGYFGTLRFESACTHILILLTNRPTLDTVNSLFSYIAILRPGESLQHYGSASFADDGKSLQGSVQYYSIIIPIISL